MEWVFLTALKANMDSAPRDATLVHNMQRLLEELEQGVFALEQEPCGPEEPSIFDGKTVSDGDDESYEIAGSCLAVRPTVRQQK